MSITLNPPLDNGETVFLTIFLMQIIFLKIFHTKKIPVDNPESGETGNKGAGEL